MCAFVKAHEMVHWRFVPFAVNLLKKKKKNINKHFLLVNDMHAEVFL